ARSCNPRWSRCWQPSNRSVSGFTNTTNRWRGSPRKLSANGATGTGEGSGDADRTHLPADAGRSVSFSQEPGCGLLCGIAARTAQLGAERAAAPHQQRRRSLSANVASAGSAPHSGSVWSGQRPAALGFEAGRARRKEGEEASRDCDGAEAGGVVASVVGE